MAKFDDESLVEHGLNVSSMVKRDNDGGIVDADFTCGLLTDSAVKLLAARTDMAGILILNLSWCPISDEALPPLTALQSLETLILSNTRVTDAGIAFLAEMPNLSHIALEDTDVTPGGVDKLKQLLPQCVVGA